MSVLIICNTVTFMFTPELENVQGPGVNLVRCHGSSDCSGKWCPLVMPADFCTDYGGSYSYDGQCYRYVSNLKDDFIKFNLYNCQEAQVDVAKSSSISFEHNQSDTSHYDCV